jgi:ribose/xylose/arabinose/galactoside ABC-type transport system permease subunit
MFPQMNLTEFAKRYLTEIVLLLGCIGVLLFTSLFNDAYYVRAHYNAEQIIRQASMLGIFAIGAAIVIIAGGIDLSSGSMIAFGGAICCTIMMTLAHWVAPDAADPTRNIPLWITGLAILATIAVGLLVGTFHTWLITVVGLPPFVATLASLVGLRSLARIMNQAVMTLLGNRSTKINIQDESFRMLGKEWWIPLVIFLVLAVAAWIMMNRTVIGRHLLAMGGNEAAARLSGIRTERLKWLAYCIGTATAALAGILFSSEVGSSDPQTQGVGYELFAIAAAVVGGCSLRGGIGRISGVVLGALFLRVVVDAVGKLIGSGADDYQGLIVGLLVVLAVAFNQLSGQSRGWTKQFFPGLLGWLAIATLSVLICVVLTAANVKTVDARPLLGLYVGGGVFAALTALKLWADSRSRLDAGSGPAA